LDVVSLAMWHPSPGPSPLPDITCSDLLGAVSQRALIVIGANDIVLERPFPHWGSDQFGAFLNYELTNGPLIFLKRWSRAVWVLEISVGSELKANSGLRRI